jgi:uncharacterized protein DUF3551
MKVESPCVQLRDRPAGVISLEENVIQTEVKMNRFRVNLIAASAVAFGLALAGTALAPTGAYAQRAPDSYPYCALGDGWTNCYFDSWADCAGAGAGRCVENPGFNGGNAMARATSRR